MERAEGKVKADVKVLIRDEENCGDEDRDKRGGVGKCTVPRRLL